MTPRAEELTITILRIIADGRLGGGAEGTFAKLEDIVEEIGDKKDVKDIIGGYLLPMNYIRKINDKFKQAHNHELDYVAYQITQLGRTYLSNHGSLRLPTATTNRNQEFDYRIMSRLNQLIEATDKVLATHIPNPPNVIGPPTLNDEKFQQWKASCENLLEIICGPDSNYLKNFKKSVKGGYRSNVEAGKGILGALKEDIESGVYGNLPSEKKSAIDVSAATVTSDTVSLKINDEVYKHIKRYLDNEDFFHAVEEAYKVVREKLRIITGKEKATDIFNMNAESSKYHEAIFGRTADPDSAESDFFRGVGYLNLTIQFLRNEKSHSLATPLDKNLAIHYVSLASLAYDLISRNDSK